jgi:hypothetical protein
MHWEYADCKRHDGQLKGEFAYRGPSSDERRHEQPGHRGFSVAFRSLTDRNEAE